MGFFEWLGFKSWTVKNIHLPISGDIELRAVARYDDRDYVFNRKQNGIWVEKTGEINSNFGLQEKLEDAYNEAIRLQKAEYIEQKILESPDFSNHELYEKLKNLMGYSYVERLKEKSAEAREERRREVESERSRRRWREDMLYRRGGHFGSNLGFIPSDHHPKAPSQKLPNFPMTVDKKSSKEKIRCPYCHDQLKSYENQKDCKGCKTSYHLECVDEFGRCAIMGCVNRVT